MLYDEDMERSEVLQRLNRAVRRRNTQLRTALTHTRTYTDSVIADLFDAPSDAQNALEKIRTLGKLECGPDDYETIVAACVEALGQSRYTS
jgi:hypothetical protein